MDKQTRKILTAQMERTSELIAKLCKDIDRLREQLNEHDDTLSALKKVLRREVEIDYEAWEHWKRQQTTPQKLGAGGWLSVNPHVYQSEPVDGFWRVYAGDPRFIEWNDVPEEFVTVLDTE